MTQRDERVLGLLEAGVIAFAKRPRMNADTFTDLMTMTMVAEDYPAKTPLLWNSCYDAFTLPYRHAMFVGDPANAGRIFDALRADPTYQGGGMGVGFKVLALELADERDPVAEAIGSANVIEKREGSLVGFNTDGTGYRESLARTLARTDRELKGAKVVMIGSGGTAQAIAYALAEAGAHLVILNRTMDRAEKLATAINSKFALDGVRAIRADLETTIDNHAPEADVIVNVSMKGAAGALARYSALAPATTPVTEESVAENHRVAHALLASLPKTIVISDVILGAADTPMIASAKKAGFETLDGVPMVYYQGREAFWIIHHDQLTKRGISKEDVGEVMKRALT